MQPVRTRTALVTGAGRRAGIGAAIARRLAADGFDLFLQSWAPHDAAMPWGADEGGVELLTAELGWAGRRVAHLSLDLADPAAPGRLVAAALAQYGHIDVLVANHARSSQQTLEQLTAAELDLSHAVNTRATLLLVKEYAAAADLDIEAGAVVLFTSGQHLRPAPEEIPYVSSKGALHQITRSLAAHLAPRWITVNCINPGPTDTGWADDATQDRMLKQEPMQRLGQPEDAARVVSWLCGPEARWVTGQVIDSEGGFGTTA